MSQAFTSWSGGKDSCLACYQAIASGIKVRYLLNMVTEDGRRSWSHGLAAELLQVQAEAIGIPLIQKQTESASYEAEFKNALLAFRREGIISGVFGDIDFEEHWQWIDRVCREVNITPLLPLWGKSQDKILRDFIDSGFEAVVVTTKADLLGEEWLGREIGLDFLADLAELSKMKNITPCGEAGEYHTLVIAGPLFGKRIEILETNKVLREGYWFLEILKSELREGKQL